MTVRNELDLIRVRKRLFGEHLLSDPAWEILIDIADGGCLKTSSVGATTRIPLTTVLRYLDALEAEGLIERKSAEGDNRLTLILLSAKGQQALDEYFAAASLNQHRGAA